MIKDTELIGIKEIISLLRLQKHDFLNHLQVVAGFLQLNKQAMAREYLMDTIAQIQQEGNALRIQSPELVGVLYLYKTKCEQLGMTVNIEVADEMLEWGEKGKIIAKFLKEMLEMLFLQVTHRKVSLNISFVRGEKEEKICKIVLAMLELEQAEYNNMEKIKAFIDEESAAYYKQIENMWIIEFIIE